LHSSMLIDVPYRLIPRPPRHTLFPYTTLFRSAEYGQRLLPSSAGRTTMCPTELRYDETVPPCIRLLPIETRSEPYSLSEYRERPDRKSTRLNSSHVKSSYAVFCLKKKRKHQPA